MTCALRFVPWKNKAEWLKVYEEAFSEDFSQQENAYYTMLLWERSKDCCPHAINCTSALMQVQLKDAEFNQSVTNDLSNEDLQMMYSAAVMRVINIVTEPSKKSKLSMYQLSRGLGIPGWIVSLRHQIAHGNVVVDLSQLRNATVILKACLKEAYWDPEKDGTRDLVIERPRGEIIKERFLRLLEIYKMLRKYEEMGYTRVQNISDPEDRHFICNLTDYRANLILQETEPWVYPSSTKDEIPPSSVEKYSINKTLKLAMELCKDYLKSNFCNYNTPRVLIDVMTDENTKEEIWVPLVLLMNSWGNTRGLLSGLVEACREEDTRAKLSAHWLLKVIRAVIKRRKVVQLKALLSKERVSTHHQDCEIDPYQRKIIKDLLLKRRLHKAKSTSGLSTLQVLAKMIEKRNPELKNSMTFKTKVEIPCQEIKSIIRVLAIEPTKSSVACIPYLLELLVPRMSKKNEKNLLNLIKLYVGEDDTEYKVGNIQDISSLVKGETITAPMDCQITPEAKKSKSLSEYDWKSCPFGMLPWERDSRCN